MNIFTKKTLFQSIIFLNILLCSSKSYTACPMLWKAINIIGGAGSTLSVAFWAPYTIAFPHAILPRVILDASCVGASIRNDQNKTKQAIFLNGGCLIGSAYSLGLWVPAIVKNFSNPLYVARGVIDALQIVLAAKRLYSYYEMNKETAA